MKKIICLALFVSVSLLGISQVKVYPLAEVDAKNVKGESFVYLLPITTLKVTVYEVKVTEVKGYYMGRNYVHFQDDDEEDVLADMVGCEYYCGPDGRDITELTENEWNALYQSIPWTKAIVVYITT